MIQLGVADCRPDGLGRGIAEWGVHGSWRTLDLSTLSPARVLSGQAWVERAII